MKIVLVGYKPVKFKFRDGSGEGSGFRLYTVKEDDKAVGTCCGDDYVDSSKVNINLNDLLNHEIQIMYNKYGKIEALVDMEVDMDGK